LELFVELLADPERADLRKLVGADDTAPTTVDGGPEVDLTAVVRAPVAAFKLISTI